MWSVLVRMNHVDRKISLARQAIQRGDAKTALKIADELLAANRRNIDLVEIKAVAEMMLGQHASAEQSLRSAIAIAPERRWPYADLSRLLLKLGRTDEAEKVAREALKQDAKNPDAHAILGSLLAGREIWIEAGNHFWRAAELAGPHPQLLAGFGQALLRQGRLNEARSQLQSAVRADPNLLEANIFLAEVEERLGQFDVASAQLDKAERIARAAGTDVDLQRSVLLSRQGKHEEALALLGDRPGLSGSALLQRGRVRDRLGYYSEAWSDWTAGKAQLARQRNHHYDAAGVEAQADALSSFFASKTSAALPRARRRDDKPQPIFIIGFPRSGTTLAEQILASHSRIAAGGELPLGGELRTIAGILAGGEAMFPRELEHIADPSWPEMLRDHYLERVESLGLLDDDPLYFTDKMPANDMWLPLIRLAFPTAPVILVRRHPLDVLTSVMSHDMTHGFHCAYRLQDSARHLALVDRLLAKFGDAGIGATHELCYEYLVRDQVRETERLMEAVALPLEESQLSFHERASVSPTPSYAQVAEPMNDRSIGRWRNYRSELEGAYPIVAEAIARGGYAD
jgi:tetratricopeptide (TPR) repeat protein